MATATTAAPKKSTKKKVKAVVENKARHKEVFIRRQRPRSLFLSDDIVQDARTVIGSVFIGSVVLRPFNPETERKIIPLLTKIDPEDKEFREKADDYWAGFSINVGDEGVKLDLSTDANGLPVDMRSFARYHFCLAHPFVGLNEEEMRSNVNMGFYLFDEELIAKADNVKVLSRRDAYVKFAEVSQSGNNMMFKMILRMRKVNPDFLSDIEIENKVAEIVNEEPNEFLKIVADKDLEMKAFLEELVGAKVVDRIGNAYQFGNDLIGESQAEAVIVLNSRKNTSMLNALKAALVDARKSVPSPTLI